MQISESSCRDIAEILQSMGERFQLLTVRFYRDIAVILHTNFKQIFAETVQRYCRAGAEIFQTHLSDMRSYCRAGAEIFQAVIADIYREIAELMQRYYGDVSGSFC